MKCRFCNRTYFLLSSLISQYFPVCYSLLSSFLSSLVSQFKSIFILLVSHSSVCSLTHSVFLWMVSHAFYIKGEEDCVIASWLYSVSLYKEIKVVFIYSLKYSWFFFLSKFPSGSYECIYPGLLLRFSLTHSLLSVQLQLKSLNSHIIIVVPFKQLELKCQQFHYKSLI